MADRGLIHSHAGTGTYVTVSIMERGGHHGEESNESTRGLTEVEGLMTRTTVFNIPLPSDMKALKGMSPIVIKQPYQIDYIHSYGQDSPFFAGLSNGKLLGTKCGRCDYTYATPRLACTQCGGRPMGRTPPVGRVHTFTTCYFGGRSS